MNYDEDIESLIESLSSCDVPSKTKEAVQREEDNQPLDEKDVKQYVIDRTKTLIETSLATVQDIAPAVSQTGDNKEVEALSKLIGATAQALDVLNRGALIDKKADRDEQLEEVRHQHRLKQIEIQYEKQQEQLKQPTNVVIASREDIIKTLYGNKEPKLLDDKFVKVIENENK